jgi:phospho-N-acetylmuramoyl-pentapeptide-transferase
MRLQAVSDWRSFAQQALNFFIGAQAWFIPLFFFVGALVLMLLIGNGLIDWLQKKQWKKGSTVDETWTVREDTPDTHQKKQGTPSMGGLGIIAATLLSLAAMPILGIMLGALLNPGKSPWPTAPWHVILSVCLLPLVLLLHGALGFADDWSKASGRGGLRARTKLAGQIFLAGAFVTALMLVVNVSPQARLEYWFTTSSFVLSPFLSFAVVCGLLMFIVIAVCNAVNLADGIDGLAAGLAVQCGLALFAVGYGMFGLPVLSMWTTIALAGACFGFLFFNKHKARVFMGDTGSLAIGAALGAGAILQHAVFLLPFIGFIYFVEMFSVIAQVAWFKFTKKRTGEGQRLFRRAPLHHHFELSGWSEWRVVATFWAVNLFTSVIGLWLWKAGVLPRWP